MRDVKRTRSTCIALALLLEFLGEASAQAPAMLHVNSANVPTPILVLAKAPDPIQLWSQLPAGSSYNPNTITWAWNLKEAKIKYPSGDWENAASPADYKWDKSYADGMSKLLLNNAEFKKVASYAFTWEVTAKSGDTVVGKGKKEIFIQAVTYNLLNATAKLVSVTFTKIQNQSEYVMADQGNAVSSTLHWIQATPPKAKPMSWTRGTKIKAAVNVTINPPPPYAYKVFIRGSGDAAFNTFVYGANSIPVTFGVQANNPLVAEVKYVKNFKIKYEVTATPNVDASWQNLGTSDNPIYQTWAHPLAAAPRDSVFYIGCTAADGTAGIFQVNDNLVVNKIIGQFAPPNGPLNKVKDKTGTLLSYYGPLNNSFANNSWNSPEQLLQNKSGTSQAWSKLFLDVLNAQGLANINNGMPFKRFKLTAKTPPGANNVVSQRLAIKNWTVNPAGLNPPAFYKIVSTDAGPTGQNPVNPGNGEAADKKGLPGQGNSPNPPAIVSYHYLVQVDAITYVDPAYGKDGLLANWQNQILEGTAVQVGNQLRLYLFKEVTMTQVPN